jgi:hypothetical protein
MANEWGLDSSGISTALPEIMQKKALKARYAAAEVWKYCLNGVEGDANVKGQISQMGQKVTIQIMPALTVYDVATSDGSFTNNEGTLSPATVTINKWKAVPVDLVDIVAYQTPLDWETELADAFGKAISAQQDGDVLDLVDDLTNYQLGDAGGFSDAKVLLAQRTLDDANVPKEDRTWVLAPVAQSELLQVDKFTIASATGFARGLQVDNGRISGLYGTRVVTSTKVVSSAGKRYNVLFHREAFAIVMQKDFKFEKLAKVRLSQPYVGSALYGVVTSRDNHAVAMSSGA